MPRSGVRGFRADKLRELRLKAGLSPDDLAARIGITRQSVSTWETGRSTPPPPTLGALAEALETSIAVLVPIPANKMRLGDLRVRAALTQVQVARRLGMSPTAYVEIEKGARMVREDRVDALAGVYGVDRAVVLDAWERSIVQRQTRANNR